MRVHRVELSYRNGAYQQKKLYNQSEHLRHAAGHEIRCPAGYELVKEIGGF